MNYYVYEGYMHINQNPGLGVGDMIGCRCSRSLKLDPYSVFFQKDDDNFKTPPCHASAYRFDLLTPGVFYILVYFFCDVVTVVVFVRISRIFACLSHVRLV